MNSALDTLASWPRALVLCLTACAALCGCNGGPSPVDGPDSPDAPTSTQATTTAPTRDALDELQRKLQPPVPDDSGTTNAGTSDGTDDTQQVAAKPTEGASPSPESTTPAPTEEPVASAAPAPSAGEAATPPSPAPPTTPSPAPLTPEVAKKHLEELETTVRKWVESLDAADAEAVSAFSVTDEFLKANVNPGNYAILSGTLLPKNANIIGELLRISKDRDVKILNWTPGTVSLTKPGRTIFTGDIPLVSKSVLEISLGEFPVELEFTQFVKYDEAWHLMELVIKS